MPIIIDIKSNGYYLKGISQEISQAKIEMIINGSKSGISIELLANISGISIEEISSFLKKIIFCKMKIKPELRFYEFS